MSFASYKPTWCPGCGNYGIYAALQKSLTTMGLDPSHVAIVFGIGCTGNMSEIKNT